MLRASASAAESGGDDACALLARGALRRGHKIQIRPAMLPKAKAGQIAPLPRATNAAIANNNAGQRANSNRRCAPPRRITNNRANMAARARRTGVSTRGTLRARRRLVEPQNLSGSPSSEGNFNVMKRSRSSWRAAKWVIRISPSPPSASRSSKVSPCGKSSR